MRPRSVPFVAQHAEEGQHRHSSGCQTQQREAAQRPVQLGVPLPQARPRLCPTPT